MSFIEIDNNVTTSIEYVFPYFAIDSTTILHIENCALINAFNIKKIDIWKKGSTYIEFAKLPSELEINYVKTKYNAELTNMILSNNTPIDIFGKICYTI